MMRQSGGPTHRYLMDELERAKRLRTETDRQRIALIETDIDVAATFLRLALTELDIRNLTRVDQLLAMARIAYAATAKFLTDVADPDEWQRLHNDHQALADAIREVERRRRRHEEQNL
jgi:hypothetical protein